MQDIASRDQSGEPQWERITYVVFERAAAPASTADGAPGDATAPSWVRVDAEDAAWMAKVLATLGFTLREYGPRVLAESPERSVEEVRHVLIGAGFHDREFRTLVQLRPRRGGP